MIIDILTSTTRDSKVTEQTVEFWRSAGYRTRLWDNTHKPCGEGRNRMLRDFYDSNREWCVMCDDDITLYPHRYLTQQFIDTQSAFQQQDVDVFSLNSNNEMHRQQQYTWWSDAQQPLFQRDWTITKWFAVRKTHKEYWFEHWYGLEDVDFALQHIRDGRTVARLSNVFLREQGFNKSSLFSTHEQRRQGLTQGKEGIRTKWGIERNKKQWVNKHWQARGKWQDTTQGWICTEDTAFADTLELRSKPHLPTELWQQ